MDIERQIAELRSIHLRLFSDLHTQGGRWRTGNHHDRLERIDRNLDRFGRLIREMAWEAGCVLPEPEQHRLY